MAEKGLITKSTLTDIGNAIRAKNGLTTQYTPSQMAAAIKAITTGSDTSSKDTLVWARVCTSGDIAPILDFQTLTLDPNEYVIPRLQTIASDNKGKMYTLAGTYPGNSDENEEMEIFNRLYIIISGTNFHFAPLSGPQFFNQAISKVKTAIKSFGDSNMTFLVVHSSLVKAYATCDGWGNFGLTNIICYDKVYNSPMFEFTKKYSN